MKVLVIDDHYLVLEGMRYVLEELDEEVEVLAARRAVEGIALLDNVGSVDLILVDLAMPDMDGFDFLAVLEERECQARIVVLSASEQPRDIRRAWSANVDGYVLKSYRKDQILAALTMIMADEPHWPSACAVDLDEETPLLSERQREVLRLVCKGCSNKETARLLSVTEATVKFHVTALLRAFGVSNRVELCAEANRAGL